MNYCLELQNINKTYGSRQVLTDLNFKVQRGHIHGLLGPNGAGKTTTMKIITGLLSIDSGNINLSDVLIGHLLEKSPLYEDMYVEEFLIYIASLHKYPKVDVGARVSDVLEKLGLMEVKNRTISNLSRGFKQRVAIGQAIVHDPDLVILDEPTIGLDPQSVVEIRNLILSLKKDHTVIISSHQLHEISLICDEISILVNGQIVKEGNLKEIMASGVGLYELSLETKSEKAEFETSLKQLSEVERIYFDDGVYKISTKAIDSIRPKIVSLAIAHGLDVYSFTRSQKSLEDIFINITDKHND